MLDAGHEINSLLKNPYKLNSLSMEIMSYYDTNQKGSLSPKEY